MNVTKLENFEKEAHEVLRGALGGKDRLEAMQVILMAEILRELEAMNRWSQAKV